MNKPFAPKHSHSDIPSFSGTYNDFLVLVIHKIMMDGNRKLSGLNDTLLTILANVSPFATTLCMTASMSLSKLFHFYASPRTLLSNPHAHHYVQLILEAFNNLIQYQYSGNSAIVYSVVHYHQTFKNLSNLRIRSNQPRPDSSLELQAEGDPLPLPTEPSDPSAWIPTNEWVCIITPLLQEASN